MCILTLIRAKLQAGSATLTICNLDFGGDFSHLLTRRSKQAVGRARGGTRVRLAPCRVVVDKRAGAEPKHINGNRNRDSAASARRTAIHASSLSERKGRVEKRRGDQKEKDRGNSTKLK